MSFTPRVAELISEIFLTPGHPDPYPLYRELRQIGPVHDTGNTRVAVTYDLCNALLRDRRLVIWDRWPEGQPGFAQSACLQSAQRAMVYSDPPDHGRLRGMMGTAFLPRRVQGLRDYVRTFISDRLDEVGERGTFDLIADVAVPLPLNVLGELLGIPPSERAQCHAWTGSIAARLGNPGASVEQARLADQATEEFEEYLRALAIERRARPLDDLISELVTLDGPEAWASEDEMLSNLNSLVIGAFETTIFSIGNSVHALLRHPDQLELLRQDPSRVAQATEELLRFDPPLQFTTPRTALADVEVGGVILRSGESLLPLLGAANRDPAHVSDPDRLDIRRPDSHPLVFGAGIHTCIGAALARIEVQETLLALIRRFARIELADDQVDWVQSTGFRGPRVLRLAVEVLN